MSGQISRSILLLDDDSSFRSLVAHLLKFKGLEVIEASSAKQATALLTADPLLAIVDYRMPDQDGMSWIANVRETGRNFPIVFLTASWCDEKTFHWLRNQLKVSLILRKPIAPELFVQQIEMLLPAHLLEKSGYKSTTIVGLPAWTPQTTIEEVDKKIADQGLDPAVLDQLRHLRSRIARQDKIISAKHQYSKEVAEAWGELSRKVSLVQQQPDQATARNEAIDIAHRVRGTAGSMGFSRVGEVAGKVEELLRGLDPTDTLREVMWTELFRALADGETFVREITEGSKQESQEETEQIGSKVVVVGKEAQYQQNIDNLKTTWPVSVQVLENLEAVRQSAKKTSFDAVIFDLDLTDKENLFALSRDIRMVPGHEALPLSVVCPSSESLSQADRAYLGCSALISKAPDKSEMELIINKLLSLRQQQKPRILTVDDDNVLTKFISTVLSAEDMLVRELNKPVVILEAVEQFKPDLILLDVMMPGLSGYDVCRMLRSSEKWRQIPILFLTSKNDQQGRAAAFQAGGNDFLSKPVLTEELIARVRAQLDLAENRRARPEKDSLTGALTSNDFMLAGAKLLDHAQASTLPMTLAFLTLDNFVQLSFVHGWSALQTAIAALGKLIQCRFKAEDLRGRLGEDGMVLAFLGENKGTIEQAMNMLLQEFAATKLVSETTGGFSATFSFGLAEYPADGASFQKLVNVANQKLLSGRLERRGLVVPAN